MSWNLDKIRFLHPPDDFTGAFTNKQMQERHLAMQQKKILEINTRLENEKDPVKAMHVLNRLEHIRFVTNNLEKFKEERCLEEVVLLLYYHKNTPFASAGAFDTWKFLFENCDKKLLYQQGKPFEKESITAYRGSVTGIAKGFSWTIDKQKVAWILQRWEDKSLGGGTVFSQKIRKEQVLVYLEDEKMKEVIVSPALAEAVNAVPVTSI